MANTTSMKRKKSKWVRCKDTYSNSIWHIEYKHHDDDTWFPDYGYVASRFVTGHGVFDNTTTENALKVPVDIRHHRRHASIMSYLGLQSHIHEDEAEKGVGGLDKIWVDHDSKQILTRVKHIRPVGKMERMRNAIPHKLPKFEAALMRTNEPTNLFMKQHVSNQSDISLGHYKLEIHWGHPEKDASCQACCGGRINQNAVCYMIKVSVYILNLFRHMTKWKSHEKRIIQDLYRCEKVRDDYRSYAWWKKHYGLCHSGIGLSILRQGGSSSRRPIRILQYGLT